MDAEQVGTNEVSTISLCGSTKNIVGIGETRISADAFMLGGKEIPLAVKKHSTIGKLGVVYTIEGVGIRYDDTGYLTEQSAIRVVGTRLNVWFDEGLHRSRLILARIIEKESGATVSVLLLADSGQVEYLEAIEGGKSFESGKMLVEVYDRKNHIGILKVDPPPYFSKGSYIGKLVRDRDTPNANGDDSQIVEAKQRAREAINRILGYLEESNEPLFSLNRNLWKMKSLYAAQKNSADSRGDEFRQKEPEYEQEALRGVGFHVNLEMGNEAWFHGHPKEGDK